MTDETDTNTVLTAVESLPGSAKGRARADEFGALLRHADGPGTPNAKTAFFDPWDDTLIDDAARRDSQLMLSPLPKAARRASNYSTAAGSQHTRTYSGGPDSPLLSAHGRTASGSGSYRTSS